jgi:hypothetical protein
MTQALLAERFHMEPHRAPKPVRHLELTAGKKGPKLPASQEGAARHLQPRPPVLRSPVDGSDRHRGSHDVRLEWASTSPSPAETGGAAPLPDIVQAVEEQLGLHLESKKTPIDIVAIDPAGQIPVAN